ncbi:MAG: folylpolyglutamate synthase/dihydrofolate synthase family protein [Dehalococcoidales bacterium]|nr:folylpolyglutamate synthase/dihydrofolate synthase family protein [Dehalococcoidales bacterium]
MIDSPFQQALDYIYSFIDYERQVPRVRQTWDIRRVEDLFNRLGNPHLKSKTVHIAGSKGKGSVAAMTSSVLTAAGYRTGLYTSPHLHLYNERIRIDGNYITNEEIVALVDRIKPAVEAVNKEATYGNLTTFEVTTALGFSYFADKKVDFQVIEVGLGGRLDATNIVKPEVCAITSISYEHMDLLGNTLTAIATEKAGIIKPGCTVVVSPQVEEAGRVFEEIARQRQARLIRVGKDITYKDLGFDGFKQTLQVKSRLGDYRLTIPLLGQYQLDNASVAVGVLEVLMEKGYRIPIQKLTEGMAKVSWEARLQALNRRPLVVVDGAHNGDSVHKLREALKHYFRYDKAILILGLSGDKDMEGIVAELAPAFDRVIVTRSIHPRAMATAPIATEFRKHGIEAQQTDDISIALPMALKMAGEKDLICVTGSLFVAAGAIEQAMILGLKT